MIDSAFGKYLSNKHNAFLIQTANMRRINWLSDTFWYDSEGSHASLEMYIGAVDFLSISLRKPLRQTTSKEYKPKGVPETINPLMIYISKMNIPSLLGIFGQFSENSPWRWVCKTVYIYIKPYENVPCFFFVFFFLIMKFMHLTEWRKRFFMYL